MNQGITYCRGGRNFRKLLQTQIRPHRKHTKRGTKECHLGGRARPPADPANPKKLLEPSGAGMPTGGTWDSQCCHLKHCHTKYLISTLLWQRKKLTCPTPVSPATAVLPWDLPHLEHWVYDKIYQENKYFNDLSETSTWWWFCCPWWEACWKFPLPPSQLTFFVWIGRRRNPGKFVRLIFLSLS